MWDVFCFGNRRYSYSFSLPFFARYVSALIPYFVFLDNIAA
ncbi:hypothetical protein JCM19294_2210 [Nonlabens tegetincola]|uniref:Uncharacterized protein n=1 Tax=Nonlabens tegetincola TaxID=323273 RepID=A0A090Q155_9FLAO|nr:hypothetical protein JCM19294_2210 [Nonlabens tegetincola]